jgi:hypothetical protein
MEGVGKMGKKDFSVLLIPAQNISDPDIAVTVKESRKKKGLHEAESNLGVKQVDADPVMAAYTAYLFSLERYKNRASDDD